MVRIEEESRNGEKNPSQEGFESFYKSHYNLVLRYLIRRVNSLQDAEDITGKVFLYCYEKWESYDPSKASQATWLFMVVRSKWIDFLRSHRVCTSLDSLDTFLELEDDPIKDAIRVQAIRDELTKALKELPDKQRMAVIMRYFGNYSDEIIAERLDTTIGNVRVIIHRGIKRLSSETSLRQLYAHD